jgi:hypothetical protein
VYLGKNKFEVTTIPGILGTMTELTALDISGLGYTGKRHHSTCPITTALLLLLLLLLVVLPLLLLLYIALSFIPQNTFFTMSLLLAFQA